ncbi:hypothetical protein R1sor_016827 [Riccia sorocarpa]|uniref:Uncharacterized protein n=1 Tax=Riccia sorocarpa TaxID=122646 RepID=A0ABD3HGJ6_9MARC
MVSSIQKQKGRWRDRKGVGWEAGDERKKRAAKKERQRRLRSRKRKRRTVSSPVLVSSLLTARDGRRPLQKSRNPAEREQRGSEWWGREESTKKGAGPRPCGGGRRKAVESKRAREGREKCGKLQTTELGEQKKAAEEEEEEQERSVGVGRKR